MGPMVSVRGYRTAPGGFAAAPLPHCRRDTSVGSIRHAFLKPKIILNNEQIQIELYFAALQSPLLTRAVTATPARRRKPPRAGCLLRLMSPSGSVELQPTESLDAHAGQIQSLRP